MATEGLPFFAMNPIIAGSKLCFRKSVIIELAKSFVATIK